MLTEGRMFAAAAVVMTCLAEEFGANNLAASMGLFYHGPLLPRASFTQMLRR